MYNSKEEIFETVVKALAIQGKMSVNKKGCCAYRGENGEKCAIGHLIPDDVYFETMEHVTWRKVVDTFGLENQKFLDWYKDSGLGRMDMSLFLDLQNTHDDSSTWESKAEFIARFNEVGQKHGIGFNWDVVEFSEKLN